MIRLAEPEPSLLVVRVAHRADAYRPC
ncbi:MAG: hypothetical protein DLM59_17565 [Pseudonocardiales bacterium]|nr:MAG: hypothetical protein DLM59_17565 [Pseudonocardiales bacterium]